MSGRRLNIPSILYRHNGSIWTVFSNLDIVFSLLHRDYVVHEGKNLTIKCDDGSKSEFPALWSHNGENVQSNYNLIMVILMFIICRPIFSWQ